MDSSELFLKLDTLDKEIAYVSSWAVDSFWMNTFSIVDFEMKAAKLETRISELDDVKIVALSAFAKTYPEEFRNSPPKEGSKNE